MYGRRGMAESTEDMKVGMGMDMGMDEILMAGEACLYIYSLL